MESGDLTEYQLLMTPEQAAALEAAIGPLSAPAPNEVTGERDHRPAGQRRVEALTEVCRRSSALDADEAGGGDGAAGSASAVHVVISLKDLEERTRCGEVLGSTATGTLLFRQFFMTIPDELLEASKIDGAGPFKFFRDTLIPLSMTTIAALFVIQFIYGWNQYLWPLLVTTKDSMQTIVIAIKKMIVTADALTEWQLAMATAMLAMLPPVFVVIAMQRLFVKGLVETEK